MIYKWQLILAIMAGKIHKEQRDIIEYLRTENKIQLEQIHNLLGGRRFLLTNDQRRLLAVKGKMIGRTLLKQFAGIFTPETILRWHAQLIANKYDSSQSSKMGRSPVSEELKELILNLAKENNSWGYLRIKGALKILSFKVSRSTIRRVLKAHGLEPAPDRNKGMTWSDFLRIHWGIIWTADFFYNREKAILMVPPK